MKRIFLLLLLGVGVQAAFAQDITRIEYFVNTDPGYGSATEVTGYTQGPSVSDLSFPVAVSASLGTGLHHLFIRAKDENDNWSVVSHHLFYKDNFVSSSQPDITRIEYFIDSDPGYGAGEEITGYTAGTEVGNLSFQVPLDASLGSGLHHLFVRAQNAIGNWSVVSHQLFYIDQFIATGMPDIVQVEYFVDSDPGYGNAANVPVTAGADVYDLAFSVDASSLSPGMHKLFIRAKNALGHWSVVGIKEFAVQDNGIALLDFPQTWCSNNPITISFQATGPFNASNEYKVQLSNSDGSFPGDITSRVIGTVSSNAASGTIPITIPAGMSGTGPGEYKVRLIATDPQVPGSPNAFSEEITFALSATCPCPAADLAVTGSVTSAILCFDDQAGAVLLSGAGGKAPLRYSLDGTHFQHNPAFAGLAAGSYTVTARDVNWCTATSSLEISQPTVLTFGTPVITAVTCHGGSDGKVQVNVSGGTGAYTYSIDGASFQESAEFTGLDAGEYTVTVKDANECLKASASYTLTQPQALSSVLAGSNEEPVCEGATANLTVTVTNGAGPFTVVFSDGTASYTVSGYVSGSNIGVAPTSTTTYSLVSVTDVNGCTSPTLSGTAKVNVTPKPTVAEAGDDITAAETCGLTSVPLAGNTPVIGAGLWTIVSGTGGNFTDDTDPETAFSGVVGTTYILRWTISNSPCVAVSDEVSVTFGSSLSLAIDGDNASAIIPDNVDFNLTTDDCRLIATIRGTSLTNGTTPFEASVTIDDEMKIIGSQPVLQRHFSLTPGGISPASAVVTLYVTKEEMAAFNEESTVDLPVEVSDDKANLRIWQWHGTAPPTGTPDATINPADIAWDPALQAWKIRFNVSGFSSFYITAEGATALPVELVDFSAQKNENAALLTWLTTSETNSARFEVLHSPDGDKWAAIGSVNARGATSTSNSYRYVHAAPLAGLNYYRLKMVDNDGTFSYSGIASVKLDLKRLEFSLYPNPVRDQLTISISKPAESYEIVNKSGQVVSKGTLNGEFIRKIPVENLSAGTYHVRVRMGDGSWMVRKVVVE